MKIYLVSLGAGVLVGLIYAGLQVRSPAPPAVALIGLLGILIGEQALPLAKKMLSKEPVTAAWFQHECVARITGVAPAAPAASTGDALASQAEASQLDRGPAERGPIERGPDDRVA